MNYLLWNRVSKIKLEKEKHVQYACLVPFGVDIDLGSPIEIFRFNSSKKKMGSSTNEEY
jgi:hypothetical protein